MLLWGLLLPSLYYPITFIVSLFIARLLINSYYNQMPIVYGTASKNLSIALALALSVFKGNVVLGVILCFMVQMPMLSLFYRFIKKA